MNDSVKNIMIVGVGGQGTLLASKMLGYVLMHQGYDVKVSEVHGMSQRGGSVVTYVRFGKKVYSPVIDKGEADYILSFEKLEAERWIEYLKIGGQIITNTQEVDPMPVITGAAEYPADIVKKLEEAGAKVDAKDFLSIAEVAGSSKAVNIVLMGGEGGRGGGRGGAGRGRGGRGHLRLLISCLWEDYQNILMIYLMRTGVQL